MPLLIAQTSITALYLASDHNVVDVNSCIVIVISHTIHTPQQELKLGSRFLVFNLVRIFCAS